MQEEFTAKSVVDQYSPTDPKSKQAFSLFERINSPIIPDFNLSDFQAMLKGQDYTQETIQEITAAIESYQSSLTAKRIALKSLTDKIAECKELARIVYGKDIKLDIVFNHE
jgi:predicted transcriptional regulator